MIHACYGSGCPYERPDGECRKSGWVRKCPIDMTPEEAEDEAGEDEYWRDFWADARREEKLFGC